MMGDRTAASDSDRVARDDQCWRQLPSLEFVRGRLNAVENVAHETRLEARLDDLVWRGLLLEIKTQHAIELVVWRQRLIVKLAGREFSGRTFVDDRFGNHFGVFVELVCECVDFGLQNVADDCESAVCVAVESAVAEREFGFVTG